MDEALQVPAVPDALSALPEIGWVVVAGEQWPTASLGPEDRVVIGPGGVFVVVTVEVGARPATVLLDAPWLDGEFRGDLVERAAEAGAAVLAMVPGVAPEHVRPVLCFAQESMLLERCDEVLVCSTANLVSLLTSRLPVLNTRQVHILHARLRAGMRRTAASLRQVPPQRAPEESGRSRSRLLVAGGAVALALLVAAGLALAAVELERPTGHPMGVGRLAGVHEPVAALGGPATVAGPGRVRLRATVRSVRLLPAGRVRVRLTLTGLRGRWSGDPARTLRLVGTRGRAVRRTRVLRAVPASLSSRLSLGPGRSVRGTVLLQVPPRTRLARVAVRVGEGPRGRAGWLVP